MSYEHILKTDPVIFDLINKEIKRQQEGLVMIASENFVSQAVLEVSGTPLTNKYSEGYPYKRYYTGNQYIDAIEDLAITRVKKLFNAEYANVQPHSGSSANMAAYAAILKPGDKILGIELSHGGHLTHGSSVNFSGKTYQFIAYGVNKDTERIDMDEVYKIALEHKPRLILSGTTAYPRTLDFDAFATIAKKVNAYAMADIAHIAGLCATGFHPSPVATHDIVTATTHKTLRGPRGGLILSKSKDKFQEIYHSDSIKDLSQRIGAAVFPGQQGGPLEHIIAAKAVCFEEALRPEFVVYQNQIIKNAKVLAETLIENGLRLVSNGTDNHLMLIDCGQLGITGVDAANTLAEVGIYTNFNKIPFDQRPAMNPSGVRLGTPALTSRGMQEKEMKIIGQLISIMLNNIGSKTVKEKIKIQVKELTEQYPLYQEL